MTFLRPHIVDLLYLLFVIMSEVFSFLVTCRMKINGIMRKGAILPEKRKSAEQLFCVFSIDFHRRQSHFIVIVTHMSLRIILNYSPPSLFLLFLFYSFHSANVDNISLGSNPSFQNIKTSRFLSSPSFFSIYYLFTHCHLSIEVKLKLIASTAWKASWDVPMPSRILWTTKKIDILNLFDTHNNPWWVRRKWKVSIIIKV